MGWLIIVCTIVVCYWIHKVVIRLDELINLKEEEADFKRMHGV